MKKQDNKSCMSCKYKLSEFIRREEKVRYTCVKHFKTIEPFKDKCDSHKYE